MGEVPRSTPDLGRLGASRNCKLQRSPWAGEANQRLCPGHGRSGMSLQWPPGDTQQAAGSQGLEPSRAGAGDVNWRILGDQAVIEAMAGEKPSEADVRGGRPCQPVAHLLQGRWAKRRGILGAAEGPPCGRAM